MPFAIAPAWVEGRDGEAMGWWWGWKALPPLGEPPDFIRFSYLHPTTSETTECGLCGARVWPQVSVSSPSDLRQYPITGDCRFHYNPPRRFHFPRGSTAVSLPQGHDVGNWSIFYLIAIIGVNEFFSLDRWVHFCPSMRRLQEGVSQGEPTPFPKWSEAMEWYYGGGMGIAPPAPSNEGRRCSCAGCGY